MKIRLCGGGYWSAITFATVIAASVYPIGAAAQETGIIEGRVVSSPAGVPIAEASVMIEGTNRGTTTDESGRFRIAGVPAGERVVIAQRIGHRKQEKKLTVGSAAVNQVDFELSEAAAIVAPVVVSMTREMQRRADASATIEVLDGAEIRRTRASHPSGIMNRVPGVHVADLTGEGHSTAIRQPISTKPLYLFLEDGIPTRSTGFFNHNALYEVNIPQAGGIEVLKGPGTALYGSDAVGGIINVLTRPIPKTPSGEASLEGGEYGYKRANLTGGGVFGSQGLRLDLNLTHGDGWKDGSGFDRKSGTIRWEAAAAGATFKTVLTGSKISQFDVPALTIAQFHESPSLNKAPIAYRRVDAVRFSTVIEKEFKSTLLSLTPFARYNTMELLPNWQLSFDPQVWDTRNNSAGALARVRMDFAPMRARIVLGTDLDYSPGSFKADGITTQRSGPNNIIWSGYTVTAKHYDYDVTYKQVAPYLHAEASPVARLRVDAGLRYDYSGYDYTTHLAPLATGTHRIPENTSVDYSHLSPKLGASYDASPGLNVFASYRHGFRTPSQNQLFQQNSADNTVGLEPVKVDSYEAGIRGQLGARVLYQVSAYTMKMTDDILTFITPANTREAVNAGATRHKGIELGVGVALLRDLRLDAAYSNSSQRYVEWVPRESTNPAQRVDYSGNRIETAPHTLGNILLTYSPRALGGGRAAVEWTSVGSYATNPENTNFYDGYRTMNLHFNMMPMRNAEIFMRVVNLTDRKYGEVVTYDAFQKEQFTPGSPRSVFAGLRYSWQR
jgi:iron complex outermembrane receptor protein